MTTAKIDNRYRSKVYHLVPFRWWSDFSVVDECKTADYSCTLRTAVRSHRRMQLSIPYPLRECVMPGFLHAIYIPSDSLAHMQYEVRAYSTCILPRICILSYAEHAALLGLFPSVFLNFLLFTHSHYFHNRQTPARRR